MEVSAKVLSASLDLICGQLVLGIDTVDDILLSDASVQTHPGFESPSFDVGGDLAWEYGKVINLLSSNCVSCFIDTMPGFAVVGSGSEDVKNVGQVFQTPVCLIAMRGGLVVCTCWPGLYQVRVRVFGQVFVLHAW